ncbi:hypothetical protein CBL_11521 [Carabus blaptoides fortunei]
MSGGVLLLGHLNYKLAENFSKGTLTISCIVRIVCEVSVCECVLNYKIELQASWIKALMNGDDVASCSAVLLVSTPQTHNVFSIAIVFASCHLRLLPKTKVVLVRNWWIIYTSAKSRLSRVRTTANNLCKGASVNSRALLQDYRPVLQFSPHHTTRDTLEPNMCVQ